MQKSASPVLASARTVKIGGADYRYGPLPYRVRGELENIYLPQARTPYEKIKEEVDKLSAEEQEGCAEMLDNARRMSAGWQHSVESEDAFACFSASNERWAEFLSVVLPVFNSFRQTPDWLALAEGTTKGDRDEMYAQCLEIGAYLPKFLSRAAAANR